MRSVAALLLALIAVPPLLPNPAGAQQARLINPCSFSASDAPCKVREGSYRALVPQGYGPHPAVVYLYGSLGRSDRITRSRVFRRNVVRRGYALIAPNALDVSYQGGVRGTGWGRQGRRNHPRDDLAFLRRVLRDAEARFNIDPDRLIFAGQSDGGFFIWEIACLRPEMAAAYAIHGASYGGPVPERCRAPVRFLQSHGRRDRIVPFSGPMMQGPQQVAADVGAAMRMMARTNRCGRDLERERLRGFDRRRWTDCAPGAKLDRLSHEGGHSWPAAWLSAVLDWFEERRLPPAEAVTRRVGDETGLFRKPEGSSTRFKRVPSR